MEDRLNKIQSNPASASIYAKLLDLLNKFPEYQAESKKTSLHIINKKAFLGVHPRKEGLLLNIVLSEPIKSSRIKKTERVSANRYHNEIELRSVDELDDEVAGWIKAAYVRTEAS
ncbi:MAG TPA: DUF5655 domain-containing protein [Candidatus Saccharimonadia bacterium]